MELYLSHYALSIKGTPRTLKDERFRCFFNGFNRLLSNHEAMKGLNSGAELEVQFDCTQGIESIPRWAAEEGHEVTNYEQLGEASWTITVKKK